MRAASTNAVYCRCFRDSTLVFCRRSTSWSEELFKRLEDRDILYVPSHWLAEVTNALRMAERRGRIKPEAGEEFLEQLAGFAIHVEQPLTPANARKLLHLCRKHNLTIHDAMYLDLAMRRDLDVATLDGELITAALGENVKLL